MPFWVCRCNTDKALCCLIDVSLLICCILTAVTDDLQHIDSCHWLSVVYWELSLIVRCILTAVTDCPLYIESCHWLSAVYWQLSLIVCCILTAVTDCLLYTDSCHWLSSVYWQLKIPGTKAEIADFEQLTKNNTQLSIHLDLPAVNIVIPNKQVLEVLYNRYVSVCVSIISLLLVCVLFF